jgi:hypothetical protein
LSVDAKIISGYGVKNYANVTDEGALNVIVHPHPPTVDVTPLLPFRQYFTATGSSGGSNDMRVDGSTTPVDFWVTADNVATKDTWIKTVSVIISDGGARLNLFGALSALTTGIEFLHITNENGEITIHDSIKTNLDFIRLGLSTPAPGDGTTAFRADISGSGADSYLPVIDFEMTFGLQWGLHLRKGTTDKLVFRINDDLSTGIDQFDAIAYGVQI